MGGGGGGGGGEKKKRFFFLCFFEGLFFFPGGTMELELIKDMICFRSLSEGLSFLSWALEAEL